MKPKYPCTTQKLLRSLFWEDYPEHTRRPGWTQNDYPIEVRMDFCNFVEVMVCCGTISEELARRATL